jgi:hypothetical protein
MAHPITVFLVVLYIPKVDELEMEYDETIILPKHVQQKINELRFKKMKEQDEADI